MKTRQLLLKNGPRILYPMLYKSWNDAFLRDPHYIVFDDQLPPGQGELLQDDCFCPFIDNENDRVFYLDMGYLSTYKAFNIGTGDVGPSQILGNAKSEYGNIHFLRIMYSGFGSNPVVAGSQYNGLQRIYFAKTADNDKQGGYVEFCHNYEAFSYFITNTPTWRLTFAHNGSTYGYSPTGIPEESMALVSRWDGTPGILGAASGYTTTDTPRIVV